MLIGGRNDHLPKIPFLALGQAIPREA
jgi:hypothetical protein